MLDTEVEISHNVSYIRKYYSAFCFPQPFKHIKTMLVWQARFGSWENTIIISGFRGPLPKSSNSRYDFHLKHDFSPDGARLLQKAIL